MAITILDQRDKAELKAMIEDIGDGVVTKTTSLTEDEIASCKEFASLYVDTTGRTESLIFFSDPHTTTKATADGDVTENFEKGLDRIKAVYDHTPISTCICGGDWLNNSNSKENALWILGKIDGAMKARFDRYINVVGNHDTNNIGASGNNTLSPNAVSNIWHSKYGKSYFSVDGDSTKFYVFDSWIDSNRQMTPYRWEQIDWFANALLTDKPERSAILIHIVVDYSTPGDSTTLGVMPFMDNITKVAQVFNSRSSITLNNKTYDFASAEGKVNFALGGHWHADLYYEHNDIPIVLTTQLWSDSSAPSYDLVLADYGANKLKLVRVGVGENREFDMA